MVDNLDKATRSKVMSSIRSGDTVPELLLRKALFSKGYRYRLRKRIKEAGCRPDMVLISRKACVFVDGCFWHGCPRCYRAPRSNTKYWRPKIAQNMERDKRQSRTLKKEGWNVIRIWEHEVREDLGKAVRKIEKELGRPRRKSASGKPRTSF